MTSAQGGFYSAEDADSLLATGKPEHAEGAFYVWTRDQIVEALGEERATIFSAHCGVSVHLEEKDSKGCEPSRVAPQRKGVELPGKMVALRRNRRCTAKERRLHPEGHAVALERNRSAINIPKMSHLSVAR